MDGIHEVYYSDKLSEQDDVDKIYLRFDFINLIYKLIDICSF